MDSLIDRTATFHSMADCTQEDWDIIMTYMKPFAA